MTSNRWIIPGIAVVLLMVLAGPGCRNKKRMQRTDGNVVAEDTSASRCRLDFKSARTLGRHMKENEFQFDWLSAKASVESHFDDKEESFDIRLAMRRDSAVLVTIQYLLGMQVAKVLITKDTVTFVDYIHKTYFKGDIEYINDLLHAELDFELVQAVLFGNSADFHDEESKMKPLADRMNCVYLLSTERKRRRLRKITAGQGEVRNAMQTLTLRPDYKIVKNEYIDPATERKFVATYSRFEMKDSVFAPYHVDIDIVAQKKASLKIDYVRIERGSPQRLSLFIPAKYDAIQIEKKPSQQD